MPKVVGIKFEGTAKVYWFEAGEFKYNEGDGVLVETARGIELGFVKTLPETIEDSKVVGSLKPVIRLASEADYARQKDNEAKVPSIIASAEQKVQARKLDMKIVNAQYTIDGSKLIIYFSAEGRVDFRELVKDLASAFHIRIELRQIGERDECRMLGGLGNCGRKLCCASGCDFAKVNIKMAKNQNLPLNPQKISGHCGRLMCCLSYENDYYVETNKLMPKVGSLVMADGKKGSVQSINQLKRIVQVKHETSGGYELSDYPLESVTKLDKSSAADEAVSKEDLANLKDIVD